jgi:hypothetical protein
MTLNSNQENAPDKPVIFPLDVGKNTEILKTPPAKKRRSQDKTKEVGKSAECIKERSRRTS